MYMYRIEVEVNDMMMHTNHKESFRAEGVCRERETNN